MDAGVGAPHQRRDGARTLARVPLVRSDASLCGPAFKLLHRYVFAFGRGWPEGRVFDQVHRLRHEVIEVPDSRAADCQQVRNGCATMATCRPEPVAAAPLMPGSWSRRACASLGTVKGA